MFPYIYFNARSYNLSSVVQFNWQKSGLLQEKYPFQGSGHLVVSRLYQNGSYGPSYNRAPLPNQG